MALKSIYKIIFLFSNPLSHDTNILIKKMVDLKKKLLSGQNIRFF